MGGVYVKDMDMPKNCYECQFCIEDVDEFSCIMLTGDGDCPLVEEKTGKWLIPQRRGVMSWNEKAYAECSVCHEVTFNARSMKFCPQCGARMEAEE